MQLPFINFFIEKFPLLLQKTFEHIYLTGLSTLLALSFGIPLGLWAAGTSRLKSTLIAVANILQTIPSLALLAFLIPFLGIGMKPAILTLAIYAILPIIKNTIVGIEGVATEMVEAGKSLGLNRWQRLRWIKFPLAFPTIIAGVRIAVVMCVGITTIAAFIGAGGLGDFIFQGIALNDDRLVLLGAIPAALLALLLDYTIGQFEIATARNEFNLTHFKKRRTIICILFICFLALVLTKSWHSFSLKKDNIIRVATKNFTEQYILGYLISDMIEANTHLKVEKKFNLGPTDICQRAMVKGEIDIYPEYTGTAYVTVLKQKFTGDSQKIFKTLQTEYLQKYHIVWLNPFGFNNTQALAVREDFATQYNIHSISDLASINVPLTIGAPAEFIKREDALPILEKEYDLHFANIRQMDPGLMYSAIVNRNVNVIMAFSTDGRISKYHLKLLVDDKDVFPSYYAAPLVRESILKQHPELITTLKPLENLIDDDTMQQLNYKVDVLKESPEKVAKTFLQSKGLLP